MIQGFSITQTGSSHLTESIPCQDYSKLIFLNEGSIAVSAIADGVGSCLYSDEGARCAVESAVETICIKLSQNLLLNKEETLNLMKQAFADAHEAVFNLAQRKQLPVIEFDSTLTCCICFEDGRLVYGHIGDDGVVAMKNDGLCRMITQRNKGEFVNIVVPLRDLQQATYGYEENVAGYVMMSDGVLDYAVADSAHHNRIHKTFFQNCLAYPCNTAEDFNQLHQKWLRVFTSGYKNDIRRYIHDDITFLLVRNASLPKDIVLKGEEECATIEPKPVENQKTPEEKIRPVQICLPFRCVKRIFGLRKRAVKTGCQVLNSRLLTKKAGKGHE